MQVNEPNYDGTTPLMIAASEGRDECVALLIDRGARLDAQRSSDQHFALLLACYRGHLEVVSALLEAGATHDLTTCESESALEVAAANGHYEVRVLSVWGLEIRTFLELAHLMSPIEMEEHTTYVFSRKLVRGKQRESRPLEALLCKAICAHCPNACTDELCICACACFRWLSCCWKRQGSVVERSRAAREIAVIKTWFPVNKTK